jgi:hypothetical protein
LSFAQWQHHNYRPSGSSSDHLGKRVTAYDTHVSPEMS